MPGEASWVPSALEFTKLGPLPAFHIRPDVRRRAGSMFCTPYTSPEAATVGIPGLRVGHVNVVTLAKGALRGLHYAVAGEPQTKVVTCISGRLWDVVVDIRPESPTFGQSACAELIGEHCTSVYVGEGMAHGYLALSDETSLIYINSEPFDPLREGVLDPLDAALGIPWPVAEFATGLAEIRVGSRGKAGQSFKEYREVRVALGDGKE